jgi:hypothetical protein
MEKKPNPNPPRTLRQQALAKIAAMPREKRVRLQELMAKERGIYLPPQD